MKFRFLRLLPGLPCRVDLTQQGGVGEAHDSNRQEVATNHNADEVGALGGTPVYTARDAVWFSPVAPPAKVWRKCPHHGTGVSASDCPRHQLVIDPVSYSWENSKNKLEMDSFCRKCFRG